MGAVRGCVCGLRLVARGAAALAAGWGGSGLLGSVHPASSHPRHNSSACPLKRICLCWGASTCGHSATTCIGWIGRRLLPLSMRPRWRTCPAPHSSGRISSRSRMQAQQLSMMRCGGGRVAAPRPVSRGALQVRLPGRGGPTASRGGAARRMPRSAALRCAVEHGWRCCSHASRTTALQRCGQLMAVGNWTWSTPWTPLAATRPARPTSSCM